MQRKILNLDLVKLTIIIALAFATALLYNYFNPEGLTIISIQEDETITSGPKELKFFQPVSVDSEDALLLYENNVQFIDVRSPEEYEEGHIPQAINISSDYNDEMEAILSAYQKDTPMVVYGNTNSDNIQAAAEELFNINFTRIYIYNDGYDEWEKNNYPVAR